MYAQMAQNASTLAKESAGSKEVRVIFTLTSIDSDPGTMVGLISLISLQKRCTQSLLQVQPADEHLGFPLTRYFICCRICLIFLKLHYYCGNSSKSAKQKVEFSMDNIPLTLCSLI